MSLKITYHLAIIAKIAQGKIHGFKKYRQIVGNVGSFNEQYFNTKLAEFKLLSQTKLSDFIKHCEDELGETIILGNDSCNHCRDRHSCQYVIDGNICIK